MRSAAWWWHLHVIQHRQRAQAGSKPTESSKFLPYHATSFPYLGLIGGGLGGDTVHGDRQRLQHGSVAGGAGRVGTLRAAVRQGTWVGAGDVGRDKIACSAAAGLQNTSAALSSTAEGPNQTAHLPRGGVSCPARRCEAYPCGRRWGVGPRGRGNRWTQRVRGGNGGGGGGGWLNGGALAEARQRLRTAGSGRAGPARQRGSGAMGSARRGPSGDNTSTGWPAHREGSA